MPDPQRPELVYLIENWLLYEAGMKYKRWNVINSGLFVSCDCQMYLAFVIDDSKNMVYSLIENFDDEFDAASPTFFDDLSKAMVQIAKRYEECHNQGQCRSNIVPII